MIQAKCEPERRTGSMIMRSSTKPIATASTTVTAIIEAGFQPQTACSWNAPAAPRMMNSPCAKLSTRVGANTIVNPSATSA